MHFALKVLLLVLVVAALFLPGIHGGFLLDDGINITANYVLYIEKLNFENLVYAALSFHDGNGSRALPMASFAFDFWRAGNMDASTFKITNIIIHAITTFFLAFFFRSLLSHAKWNAKQAACGALVLTLLWAVHPLQVSSVLYIVQRMQTMATLFIVLALWSYLLMRQNQMDGGRGRVQGIGVIIFWLLALTCKEDTVLFPIYTLLLELTVLRFKAGQEVVSRGLKQSYALFWGIATLVYFFFVLPKLSCWDACPRRDFNSWERLLTQGRVLVMYIGQIILPFSDRLPFIYEDYPVSRSIWQPWTTLPSILFLGCLIVWAWCIRSIRPLFAFGILLFFAGHFISSNVIPLELVFEHRNHLPLIGAILALADLILWGCQTFKINNKIIVVTFTILIIYFAANTLYQTYIWGDSTRLGQKLTKLSPHSIRAWNQYAATYFDDYNVTKNPDSLKKAISISENAFQSIESPSLAANILIYKSILGHVTNADWERYYQSLRNSKDISLNKKTLNILVDNYVKGFEVDANKLISAMDIVEKQGGLSIQDYFMFANQVYNSKQRSHTIIFFKKIVGSSPTNDPQVSSLLNDLESGGYTEWVQALKQVQNKRDVN
ncbi:hypothetical protein [Acinetobacter bereziniae]|uniref:hypothetical protein n=1 Tax=Acinetobacter bereziniae TaxID=106648 RepID=UPI002575B3D0|nr:hypothetical protein [Acinetobacter bereziniae]MDM1784667.1 hypothetical protein [Acinetobacter bereziniae]